MCFGIKLFFFSFILYHEIRKNENKKNNTGLLVVFSSVDIDLLLFITPVWKNIF